MMIQFPVYPRWRGEHERNITAFCGLGGLSPLARGTRIHADAFTCAGRFIPAGAGNTKILRASSGHGPVYPRWRGEHVGPGK
ncbi:hypothetical protein ECDEC9D_3277 [Escherichia coli DEC9D]|nr:hypothetical protein ECDEC9D_3277 [Escherichia coli DEC9D]